MSNKKLTTELINVLLEKIAEVDALIEAELDRTKTPDLSGFHQWQGAMAGVVDVWGINHPAVARIRERKAELDAWYEEFVKNTNSRVRCNDE